jgi:hypothetical protein
MAWHDVVQIVIEVFSINFKLNLQYKFVNEGHNVVKENGFWINVGTDIDRHINIRI